MSVPVEWNLSIFSLALMALWTSQAYAQQVVPGIDPECLIVHAVATCDDDPADEINLGQGSSGFERLIIRNTDAANASASIFHSAFTSAMAPR